MKDRRYRLTPLRYVGRMSRSQGEMYWAVGQIRKKVRLVLADEEEFGSLTTEERIAVALVLDRHEWLLCAWGTIVESINRLDPEWIMSALHVQRMGWTDADGDETDGDGAPEGTKHE